MYFISHILSSLWFLTGPSWIYILPMQSVPITTKVVSLNLPSRGVLNTTLCDKVCQWLATGQWVSSTNKTDRCDLTEILLKVALNTITLTLI